ncbi:MAG: hypothetical protein RL641_370 [Candidatus Parcubacteria bacterium]|jgi:DNA-binding response OmpR family regulator
MSPSEKKILIVEDERPLARALELKLAKEGFVVSIATNGQEAIDAISKTTFDIMILDLVMPLYDGFHVLAHVHDNNIPIKIIVLSNLSQNEDIDKAKGLGAKEYYVKSNTPILTLVENVKQALS